MKIELPAESDDCDNQCSTALTRRFFFLSFVFSYYYSPPAKFTLRGLGFGERNNTRRLELALKNQLKICAGVIRNKAGRHRI